jgi:hypothetical protein
MSERLHSLLSASTILGKSRRHVNDLIITGILLVREFEGKKNRIAESDLRAVADRMNIDSYELDCRILRASGVLLFRDRAGLALPLIELTKGSVQRLWITDDPASAGFVIGRFAPRTVVIGAKSEAHKEAIDSLTKLCGNYPQIRTFQLGNFRWPCPKNELLGVLMGE